MTTPSEPPSPVQRRKDFVTELHRLAASLSSSNTAQVAHARKTLAQLRRTVTGSRYEPQAFDVVFRFDPPEREQRAWLLLAGLFALNPQARGEHGAPLPLGAALQHLHQQKTGDAVSRRFTQLIGIDGESLPHYLRQALQLLQGQAIGVDYERLLADLIVLLNADPGDEAAHRVRLRWARDFHRPQRHDQDSSLSGPVPSE